MIRNGAFHIVNVTGDTVHTPNAQMSRDDIEIYSRLVSVTGVLLINTGRIFSLGSIRHHTNLNKIIVNGKNKDNGKAMIDDLRKR